MWSAYEFFAGGGMVRAALPAHEWQVVFANDLDPVKRAAYARNWGAEHLVGGDVADVRAAGLPGRADLAWASPPCQDVSLAGGGAGLGAGTRSGAFWPFWDVVEDLGRAGRAPRTVVLENVTGLLTSNGGRDFAAVCGAFARAGYTFGPLVVDAARFLPHSRPRVFVVGVMDPAAGALPHADGPVAGWHTSPMTRAWAALDADARARWRWWAPAPPTPGTGTLAAVLEDDAAVTWHTPAQTRHVLDLMQPPSARRVEQAVAAGGRAVGTLYRRTRGGVQCAEVRFDGVSGCLRAPRGGSSRQTVVVVEGGAVRTRLLTPREGARLMGLPDTYALPPGTTDALQVIGDGVAVPAVRFVVDALVRPALTSVPHAGTARDAAD